MLGAARGNRLLLWRGSPIGRSGTSSTTLNPQAIPSTPPEVALGHEARAREIALHFA
jgi:hypothetical protein